MDRFPPWMVTACSALGLLGVSLLCGATTQAGMNLASTPLFLTEALPPRVLLVLSRDHEMFKEAYPDHNDLTGDGVINNTYTDGFEYYGYFDSNKCYTYAGGRFQPAGLAGGPNQHHCSGQWSGNFLNWASMTRMDIVRRVLYGGYRQVDDEDFTVLQRELVPNSSHAFVKIFSGADGASVSQVTPYPDSQPISMCNVTWPDNLSQRSHQVNTDDDPPLLRIARGSWPTWAATERTQCAWRDEKDGSSPQSAHPHRTDDQLDTLNVRVEVCRDGYLETNCRLYPNGHRKPVGLLQRYGEDNRIHFGLLSGSYARNTSGGVLRRNIGPLVGNTGAQAQENETDPETGVFTSTQPGAQSIVNTINRLRIAHWGYDSNTFDDACRSTSGNPWGVTDITDGMCTSWGNPIGEMVLEGLRYYAGASNPSFDADDSNYIAGLPRATWRDPLPETQFCANPNMVILSSGLTTHDAGSAASYSSASHIPGLAGGTSSVISRTNEVGAGEGLSGSYIIGGSNRQCTAEGVSALGEVQGVCPEGPSLLGGYRVAGLAYHAWTHDLRPEYPRQQNVRTFAVNLAEPLPRLRFGAMEFLPTCQSRPNSSSPWSTCAAVQTDVLETEYTAGDGLVRGHFRIFWEDSTYGSDYDMDGVSDLHICRGAACGGGVPSDQVRVTVDVMAAYAGFDLRFGVLANGTTTDGLSEWVLHSGGNNFSVPPLANDNPSRQPDPVTLSYAAGASSAQLLRDPLWYAAKWGGFDKSLGSTPLLDEQWDTNGNGDPYNYYLTRNPGQLEADLEHVFAEITATVSSASTIATNSTRLSTDTILYQARFNTEDWHGQLLAFSVEADGSPGTLLWDAADLIPHHALRRIFTLGDDGGVPFVWNEDNPLALQITDEQKDALNRNPDNDQPDGRGPDRLQWLRGDQSLDPLFRPRANVLGDIVHSNPFFVGPLNFGYEALPASYAPREEIELTGADTNHYAAFSRARIDQNTGDVLLPVVYVGTNNGMLHAFHAETGEEIFAYVPSTLIEHMPAVTAEDYPSRHRYMMDGQAFVGDAYLPQIDAANPWRSILVGTTGAGGRTVFALDVTEPDNFSAQDVLWEFTHDELGYTVGTATLGPLANGQWGVILGNGYNSDSQKARLFILDAATGDPIRIVETDDVGSASAPNGLATPAAVPDSTRIIRTVYAGDLHGRLWKFDLSSSTVSNWEVQHQGNTPRPLFRARDADGTAQPITSQPEVGLHPEEGYMVYFGTGKYLEVGDELVGSSPPIQTFYGVWDKGENNWRNFDRDLLREQQIQHEVFVDGTGQEVRVSSDSLVNWSNQRGWYLDLISPTRGGQGERVVSGPVLRSGRIIFPTLVPSPSPCDGGGHSWLMEIDALTGARLPYSPFDLNDDGVVDEADFIEIDGVMVPVSGVATSEGIIQTPSIISAGAVEYKLASGTSGEVEVFRERGVHDRPRGSWRQLR